jgi:hypothetical protein
VAPTVWVLSGQDGLHPEGAKKTRRRKPRKAAQPARKKKAIPSMQTIDVSPHIS